MGTCPPLDGSTEWLNSEPLGSAELRGHVILVNFWTLTCINWLRQEPHLPAWSRAHRDDGLIVIGFHTTELSFDHEMNDIRQAIAERGIEQPLALDNDYEVWTAFDNHYWPARWVVVARLDQPVGFSRKRARTSHLRLGERGRHGPERRPDRLDLVVSLAHG